MNGNVKIVNDTLQMVSFAKVRMGWIPGMSFIKNQGNILTFDNTGTVYINTDEKNADDFCKWMIAIKGIPSKLFYTEEGFVQFLKFITDDDEFEKYNLSEKVAWKNTMKTVWNCICKIETTRRQLRKNFIKNHRKEIVIGTVRRLLKGGE